MPAHRCTCGHVIHLGPQISPEEWLLLSSEVLDPLPDQVDKWELYLDSLTALLCPHCARLWIFWKDSSPQPREYTLAQHITPQAALERDRVAQPTHFPEDGVWLLVPNGWFQQPAAVFTRLELALKWVAVHGVSGTLRRMPLNPIKTLSSAPDDTPQSVLEVRAGVASSAG